MQERQSKDDFSPDMGKRASIGVRKRFLRKRYLLFCVRKARRSEYTRKEAERTPSAPRVFYLTQEWKRAFNYSLLLFGIWPFISTVLVMLALWVRLGPILILFLGASLCVFYFLVAYFFRRTIRHVISSDGITFYSPVYCIYTPWSNIKGIGSSQVGLYRSPALLLIQPAMPGRVGNGHQSGQAIIRRYRWLTTEKDAPDNAIPLFFTVPRNWKESELGLSIRYYAPQIEWRDEGVIT